MFGHGCVNDILIPIENGVLFCLQMKFETVNIPTDFAMVVFKSYQGESVIIRRSAL